MSRPSSRHISFALLALLSLSLSGCNHNGNEPQEPAEPISQSQVVYRTDTTEWVVSLFQRSLLYSEALEVTLPPPYALPSREQAAVLRQCSFAHDERFVTSDGYTFAMPSASVSKAGTKTRYSVLGIYIRHTVIRQDF